MNILDIFFIFMAITSFSLLGFALRQRKSNELMKELVTQGKIQNNSIYSSLDIQVKDKEFVSRCPSCAEWINLRANICKYCSTDVEDYNLNLAESMRQIDEAESRVQLERKIENNEKQVARREVRKSILRSPLFRASIIIIFSISTFFLVTNVQSNIRYKNATVMPAGSFALAKSWESRAIECGFPKDFGKQNTWISDSTNNVSLTISTNASFEWGSTLGKRIICFSEKSLGINISKKFSTRDSGYKELRNGYSIYYFQGESVIFSWTP